MTTVQNQAPMRPRRPALGVRLLAYGIALSIGLAAPAVAHADFAGPYTLANWTLTTVNADGIVAPSSGDATSITITGGDNQSFAPGTTDFTILAVATGTFSFDWQYASDDITDVTTGLPFDDAGYIVTASPPCPLSGDPCYTVVAGNQAIPPTLLTGSVSVTVDVGDLIGFRVRTADNFGGPGIFTISNFLGPVPVTGEVPAPSTLALLALGAAGLGLARLGSRRSR